jgi:quercetin dioxygenase-like cupin family protein
MKIAKADSIKAKPVEMEGAQGVTIRMLIHKGDGAPNFTMRQFDIASGGYTPEHQHDWEHEAYVVAGSGTVLTPDGDKPVAAGDCIFVKPGEIHQFRSSAGEELKFLCLIPNKGG